MYIYICKPGTAYNGWDWKWSVYFRSSICLSVGGIRRSLHFLYNCTSVYCVLTYSDLYFASYLELIFVYAMYLSVIEYVKVYIKFHINIHIQFHRLTFNLLAFDLLCANKGYFSVFYKVSDWFYSILENLEERLILIFYCASFTIVRLKNLRDYYIKKNILRKTYIYILYIFFENRIFKIDFKSF